MNNSQSDKFAISSYYVMLGFGALITFFVYYPGLSGGFEFDDIINILDNDRVALAQLDIEHIRNALFSGISGALSRPISMLSFALNYYSGGFDPFNFKLCNLLIHLVNGVGIFFLTTLILKAYRQHKQLELTEQDISRIGIAVSMAWLLHPLNLTSVLYVVQRMTSLASLFMLGGLILYIWGRMRWCNGRAGGIYILGCLLIFMPLSLLTKEIGVLLPVYLLLFECSLFGFKASSHTARRFLFGLFFLIVVMPLMGFFLFLVAYPEWLAGGYAIRDFTLAERLMTEARIIWFYLSMVLLPNNLKLGIYHDDIPISHGILDPVTTLISIIGIVILLVIATAMRKRAPVFFLGILFFFAGHSLESTILSLELAHEHRNYLPDYGILLVVFYYLLHPGWLIEGQRLRYYLAVLFISLFGVTTAVRASYWGNLAEHSFVEVSHHPDSPRANYEAGRMIWPLVITLLDADAEAKEKTYHQAYNYFMRSAILKKSSAIGLAALIRLDLLMKKPIDLEVLSMLKQRLEHEPIDPSSAQMVADLGKCQRNKECQLPSAEMHAIYQSCLLNPSLIGRSRALIYAAAALNALSDQDAGLALQYANKAVESDSRDLQWRINLVSLLIALGELGAAQEQLDIVLQKDDMRAYTLQTVKLEESLLKQQANKKGDN